VGQAAVVAHWRMGDGALLTIACNLGEDKAEMPPHEGRLLFATSLLAGEAAHAGRLEPYSTIAVLTE
jgi:maltooligosyltrehalose trehalohydrolase